MAKSIQQSPLVTSVSSSLKKTIQSDTQVITPEEIKTKKRDLLGVIDQSLEIFKRNLAEGKVMMNNSLDLERLVKLLLLLSGEADSITGKPYGEQEQETTVSQALDISMSKVEEILDTNDPDVKAIFEKLYKGYNALNDAESNK